MRSCSLILAGVLAISTSARAYDVLITHATIYDGSGAAPYAGELAIQADKIAYVGEQAPVRHATRIVDAQGLAVAPGFINMLAHPEESLLADGRGLSDLVQGVTLEVMGESSMGPLSPAMRAEQAGRQGHVKYDVDWTTLDQYLRKLETRGISPNVASFVGAGTVRTNVLGERNVPPTSSELDRMKQFVRHAMEDGALGLTAALIYTPDTYASTPELIALASESARCGGIYAAHMRSEGEGGGKTCCRFRFSGEQRFARRARAGRGIPSAGRRSDVARL